VTVIQPGPILWHLLSQRIQSPDFPAVRPDRENQVTSLVSSDIDDDFQEPLKHIEIPTLGQLAFVFLPEFASIVIVSVSGPNLSVVIKMGRKGLGTNLSLKEDSDKSKF
jgi:hypothetical protein